jgi:hypothetical protein
MSQRPPPSFLVLAFEPGHLRAALVRRGKSAPPEVRAFSAPLALELLHPEPELVGREIRNQLEAAGVAERHVVVALPPAWVMTLAVALPPGLTADDRDGFLQLAAERGFPSAPEELQMVRCGWEAEGEGRVTLLAVARAQLDKLDLVLRAAGLRPAGFTLALPALPGAVGTAAEGQITLWLEADGAVLLVGLQGAVVAWRALEATIEAEAGERVLHSAALLRELRITWQQVPEAARPALRRLVLQGDPALVQAFAGAVETWANETRLEVVAAGPGRVPGEELVEQLALARARGERRDLEFLPPRPSRWAQLAARYSSRRLATAGAAVAGLLVLAGLAFAWQEYRLWSLRSRWEAMAPAVKELETVQSRIREYRSWYDTSFRNLSILRKVTECFPETGAVTAKSFEIHGQTNVTVSGTARDNASLLRTQDLLRQSREVQAVKIEQIRGKTPAQFTFNFRWSGAPTP